MFHMKHGETVRTSGGRILARFDCVDRIRIRERSVGAIQRVTLFKVFINLPGFFVLLKFITTCILLTEMVCYRRVFGESFIFKGDRLIWKR